MLLAKSVALHVPHLFYMHQSMLQAYTVNWGSVTRQKKEEKKAVAQLIARLSFQSIGRINEFESSKWILDALTCFEKKAFFELLFLSLLVFLMFSDSSFFCPGTDLPEDKFFYFWRLFFMLFCDGYGSSHGRWEGLIMKCSKGLATFLVSVACGRVCRAH